MKAAVAFTPAPPGASPEDIDGEKQSELVMGALREDGWDCQRIPFRLNLEQTRDALARHSPDCVFNLVESVDGSDRLILLAPMLLDSMGIPYTGASFEGMMLSTNKVVAKTLLCASGIATPDWQRASGPSPDGELGLKGETGAVIVKSVWDHGSVGITDSSVHEHATSSDVASLLHGHPNEVFVERFVKGREFNLSLLAGVDGVEVLPPAEIEFTGDWSDKPRIVGYEAKWRDDSFESCGTPRRFAFGEEDRRLLDRLQEIAVECWRVFGMHGYARVDFRVDGHGRPWVLEVNANPCLSSDAGFMAAARRAGLSAREVVARIVNDALRASQIRGVVRAGAGG
jgi:D-alanine-D-alanine ligase